MSSHCHWRQLENDQRFNDLYTKPRLDAERERQREREIELERERELKRERERKEKNFSSSCIGPPLLLDDYIDENENEWENIIYKFKLALNQFNSKYLDIEYLYFGYHLIIFKLERFTNNFLIDIIKFIIPKILIDVDLNEIKKLLANYLLSIDFEFIEIYPELNYIINEKFINTYEKYFYDEIKASKFLEIDNFNFLCLFDFINFKYNKTIDDEDIKRAFEKEISIHNSKNCFIISQNCFTFSRYGKKINEVDYLFKNLNHSKLEKCRNYYLRNYKVYLEDNIPVPFKKSLMYFNDKTIDDYNSKLYKKNTSFINYINNFKEIQKLLRDYIISEDVNCLIKNQIDNL